MIAREKCFPRKILQVKSLETFEIAYAVLYYSASHSKTFWRIDLKNKTEILPINFFDGDHYPYKIKKTIMILD
jgi:hypothetical protein